MGGQTDGVDLVASGERLKPLVLNMEHGDVVGNELTVQFSSGNVIVRVSDDLLDLEDDVVLLLSASDGVPTIPIVLQSISRYL